MGGNSVKFTLDLTNNKWNITHKIIRIYTGTASNMVKAFTNNFEDSLFDDFPDELQHQSDNLEIDQIEPDFFDTVVQTVVDSMTHVPEQSLLTCLRRSGLLPLSNLAFAILRN